LGNYRDTIFKMFKNLKCLDGKDEEGNQVLYSDEEDDYDDDDEGEGEENEGRKVEVDDDDDELDENGASYVGCRYSPSAVGKTATLFSTSGYKTLNVYSIFGV